MRVDGSRTKKGNGFLERFSFLSLQMAQIMIVLFVGLTAAGGGGLGGLKAQCGTFEDF